MVRLPRSRYLGLFLIATLTVCSVIFTFSSKAIVNAETATSGSGIQFEPFKCKDGTKIDRSLISKFTGSSPKISERIKACQSHGGIAGYLCGGKNDVDKAVQVSFNLGCNQAFENPLLDMLFAIIRVLSMGVGLVVVGAVILAGIQYSASQGNPEKTMAAIGRIRNALLALVLYVFLFAIIQWLTPGGIFK